MPPRIRFITLAVAAALAFGVPAAAQQPSQTAPSPATEAQPAEPYRNTAEWNLPKRGTKLAIKGYDPVAYFPEGGSAAKKGDRDITAEHRGVTYRFANEENRARFLANPNRYEPAHGGWCSWAMRSGDKTNINPKTFIVKDDRLFLFYNGFLGNTRKDWNKTDHNDSAALADASWKDISGEEKRQSRESD